MLRRDLLLVAGTAAISSLLTYLACTTITTPPDAPRYESSAANGNHAAPVSSHDDKSVVQAHAKGVDAAAAMQQDSPQPARDPALAYEKQQEREKQFSNFVASASKQGSGALNAKIETRFYQEDWNKEWAGSKESNIRTLFEASENLNGIAPLQVTCRSKNCQVVLSASNEDQVRQLTQKFMQAASKSDLGMQDKVVSFFPNVSMGQLVFYLSENGNMELFQ